MNLKTAIAIAVAAAFAVPLAAQASADADKIILAQQGTGSTMQPKDSNPAAPPATHGAGKHDSSATSSGSAASGSSTAPATTAPGQTTAPSTDKSSASTEKADRGATTFNGVDKNGDGYISRDEAREATWNSRFSELDKDNDGRLSQSEFNAMQSGAGVGATGKANAPVTSGTNSADRKPNTPKQQ